MGVDFTTRDLVVKAAIDFRRQNDALTWDVSLDELIRLQGLDQGRYGSSPWSSMGRAFRRFTAGVSKKVLALVSVKERVLLVSNELHAAREPFAKGHELGHDVLDWHRDILYVCDEHDLSAVARAQMEWEANTFSSAVLLPPPLVSAFAESNPTSMGTVLALKERAGTSITSAANSYVAEHPGKCILLVLDELSPDEGGPALQLKRKWVSSEALKTPLARMGQGQLFKPSHVLWELSRTRYEVLETKLCFKSDRQKLYEVSLMNNGYQVLALMWDPTVE